MKELGNWIPQIFYDLIGRVAPGAFLLILGIGLLVDPDVVKAVAESAKGFPMTVLVSAGLLVAYAVGTILGALAVPILYNEWSTRSVRCIIADVPDRLNSQALTAGQVSFLYDALQLFNPSAGARLVKLRAETHLCCTLFVGALVIAAAYIPTHRQSLFTVRTVSAFLGLAGMAASSYSFYVHLAIRARRLLMNYCLLQPELRQAIRDLRGGQPEHETGG